MLVIKLTSLAIDMKQYIIDGKKNLRKIRYTLKCSVSIISPVVIKIITTIDTANAALCFVYLELSQKLIQVS